MGNVNFPFLPQVPDYNLTSPAASGVGTWWYFPLPLPPHALLVNLAWGRGRGVVAPPPYNLNPPTHTILVSLAVCHCGVWMGEQFGGEGVREDSAQFHVMPSSHALNFILDGVDTHNFSFSLAPLLL